MVLHIPMSDIFSIKKCQQQLMFRNHIDYFQSLNKLFHFLIRVRQKHFREFPKTFLYAQLFLSLLRKDVINIDERTLRKKREESLF